ncbi:MAG: serine hydrolase [Faunusvirus sp.]|jgi:CubicO group peptidase (beta-lactamase class C family)|uniref:Serine hydrolase n=1 Tax=Faunusvirus sp. TaxID=2487766 RepID=A0A3G4ZY64_9VIRU|nr:MAG: serine hydrolase [Faunusvirus sp.]
MKVTSELSQYISFTGTTDIIITHGDETVVTKTTPKLIKIMSITKAITSLAIGFLLHERKLKSVKTKICHIFPDTMWQTSPRNKITVEHLLTHTSGLPGIADWAAGGMQLFIKAKNIYQYCANRELVNKPGAKWDYSNIGAQLVACIVHKLSGQQLDKYLATRLFKPLNIKKYRWEYVGGYADAMSGLNLCVTDLHKIGCCIRDKGLYNGHQIVPKKWIVMMSRPRIKLGNTSYQGYFWFVNTKLGYIYHDGSNGQYLLIAPKRRIVFARLYVLQRQDYKNYQKNYHIFAGDKYYEILDKLITAK